MIRQDFTKEVHKYRKNFKSSTSFSFGGKVGGKWTCDYSGSLVWVG